MERFKDPAVDTSDEHAALKRVRPSWDEYFMRIAHEVATRSTLPAPGRWCRSGAR
jgi:deoxycytidylate deaminase